MRDVVGRHDRSSCPIVSSQLRGGAALVFALLAIAAFGRPAGAETLEQALSDAYLVNPVLNAERARLRATDEQVALAKSGLRPLITGEADWNYVNQNSDRVTPRARPTTSSQSTPPPLPNPILEAIRQSVLQTVRQDLAAQNAQNAQNAGQFSTTDGVTHPHGYSIQLTQPLFEGFRNLNAIRQAKSTVQAARESLRSVEQTVLLDAVTAYVNVVRDTAIVRLRENDVTLLSEQLKATKDRFDVGEVTRTDVAQAEARRSEALSTLAAAQANLKTSRAAYEQIIGHPPGNLETPPSIRHLLPGTLDESMTLEAGPLRRVVRAPAGAPAPPEVPAQGARLAADRPLGVAPGAQVGEIAPEDETVDGRGIVRRLVAQVLAASTPLPRQDHTTIIEPSAEKTFSP